MDYEQWFGIMGPAGMPKPVVDRLGAAMAQVLQMPDVRERLVGMALDVAAPGPDEMKRKVEADSARWLRARAGDESAAARLMASNEHSAAREHPTSPSMADSSDAATAPQFDPRLWRDDGWTARVIKNEDDDGWAVEMTKDGEPEPALVGPWTMGRDKKNPKPLDAAAFNTLVKTAHEVRRRHEQQLHAKLHTAVSSSPVARRRSSWRWRSSSPTKTTLTRYSRRAPRTMPGRRSRRRVSRRRSS